MRNLAKLIGLWSVVGPVSACAVDEPPAESSTESSLCSIFFCGDNAAADGDNFLFDQLDLFGRSNYAGVKIVGGSVESPTGRIPAKLGVDRQWFYMTDQYGVMVRDHDLVTRRAVITLENQIGQRIEILFAGFDDSSITFQVGSPVEELPVYHLKARRTGEYDFKHNVCNTGGLPYDPLWTSHPHHAVVFRGDLYHPTKKYLLAEDPKDGWFFLGCAGSAGAKMHVFRHTHAGSFRYSDGPTPPAAYYTTPAQRTTLMKAITADLCGDGSSFTVAGQRLAFTANAPFAMPPLPPAAALRSYEAIWSTSGAVCLDHPRRETIPGALPTPPGPTWTPSEIYTRCGRTIPACGSSTWFWPWFGYAITANPW